MFIYGGKKMPERYIAASTIRNEADKLRKLCGDGGTETTPYLAALRDLETALLEVGNG